MSLNQEFVVDPGKFLATYPLNLMKMSKMPHQGANCGVPQTTKSGKLGWFDLEATTQFGTTKEVYLMAVAANYWYWGRTPLQGYYLDYLGLRLQQTGVPFVDVPSNLPPHKFVFTGQLNGCSVIVTDIGRSTLRVYHDARPNSSGQYHNVVASFDFNDYKYDHLVEYGGQMEETGFASVVMYRDPRADVWALACQLLDANLRTEQVTLRHLQIKMIV